MGTEQGKGHVNTACQDLVAAWGELQNPPFDSTNPHFRSKFASLAGVRNVVIPVLARHGFAAIQKLSCADGCVGVETVLVHESGEKFDCGVIALKLPAEQTRWSREAGKEMTIHPAGDPQAVGSVITYLRRYSLLAAVCVVGEEDDDGNAGAEQATRQTAPAARPPARTVQQPRERQPETVDGVPVESDTRPKRVTVNGQLIDIEPGKSKGKPFCTAVVRIADRISVKVGTTDERMAMAMAEANGENVTLIYADDGKHKVVQSVDVRRE